MLMASALTLALTLRYTAFPVSSGEDTQMAVREYIALLDKIEELYIGEFDIERVSEAALRAVVDSLGDRWSFYLTEEEYSSYLISMRNQFTGIGVSVAIHEASGGMEVLFIYRDSPADFAGVLEGDIIIAIDGTSITGFSISDLRDALARPVGETAELELIRASGAMERITVVYDLVFSDPISFEMLDGDIGYIAIANFEGESAKGFIAAIEELLDEGARAFIYDVRNNGGGMVNEMTRMLDYLLPEGEIFVSVDKSGTQSVTMSDAQMLDLPAVVLVDRYSFSAAEYFAATLREYDYAEIVGEQTTGKSRSQSTVLMPSGGALHISTGQYFTKNRVALYDVGGLVPDHLHSLQDKDFGLFIRGNLAKEDDTQLQLALSVIMAAIGD